MAKDIVYPNLVQSSPLLKGFLTGGLVVSGILNPWGLPVQIILAGFGIFIFIESMMPESGQLAIGETVMTAVTGAIVSALIFVFANIVIGIWGIILLAIGTVVYIRKFGRKRESEENIQETSQTVLAFIRPE